MRKMTAHHKASRQPGYRFYSRTLVTCGVWILLSACEARLNLEQVEEEGERRFHRYDMLQAAAHHGSEIVVVSSVGAAIYSADNGTSWQRFELPARPALIDVTACGSGDFFALDAGRNVWHKSHGSTSWNPSPIDTTENTLSIHCAPNGRLWVSASFGTLYWAEEGDTTAWNEFSLYEDLQFTAVRFVDAQNGFAVGEFGTVMATTDGGDTWEHRTPIPNEFYPMGVDFLDRNTGWAGGLDGVIWHTTDGGHNWQRQETVTTTPIYGIHANGHGIFAVGGSAKLVEYSNGRWQLFKGAPEVLAYIRGLDTLENGSLLVAGGGGTLAMIPLAGRHS
jgi:photosystem II stability/assembly factor-like uncharacterized protein